MILYSGISPVYSPRADHLFARCCLEACKLSSFQIKCRIKFNMNIYDLQYCRNSVTLSLLEIPGKLHLTTHYFSVAIYNQLTLSTSGYNLKQI